MMTGRPVARRALLAGAGLAAMSAFPASLAAAGPAHESGWRLVSELSDEFDDMGRSDSAWHRGLWYPTSGAGEFREENVTFSEGSLRLAARQERTPSGSQYTFGAVESRFDTPGMCSYVEVRAKALASAARVLSAIWLQSSNLNGGPELLDGASPNPEIDIEETFNFASMDMAVHTWGARHIAYGGKRFKSGVADVSAAAHTYAVERRDGHLRFYFDGKLSWDLIAPDPSLVRMSRHVVLSLEGHLGLPVPRYLPATFDVDYVRTYYFIGGRRAKPGRVQLVQKSTGLALTRHSTGSFELKEAVGSPEQLWVLEETADFTYTIASPAGVVLCLEGGRGQPGTPVVSQASVATGTDSAGSRSRWHVLPSGSDAFVVSSKFSGLALAYSLGRLEQQEPVPDPAGGQEWLISGV